MATAEMLIDELTRESATTRRLLERVPQEQMSWRPHEKSMTLGQLALHVARMPRSISDLLQALDGQPPNVPLTQAASTQELLETIDGSLAYAIERLRSWGDEGLAEVWRMSANGQTLFAMPRAAGVRMIMLNHTYHHRGQLSLYLRLLDVPVPSVYGPTADESPFR